MSISRGALPHPDMFPDVVKLDTDDKLNYIAKLQEVYLTAMTQRFDYMYKVMK